MTRQHGGAIRAIRRHVDGRDVRTLDGKRVIEFELISEGRETIRGTIGGERSELLALDDESVNFLLNFAGAGGGPSCPDLFQPYNPFVPGLHGADHDGSLLEKLGTLMAHAAGDPDQPESTLPAAYTYLGQFIAHDVTRMRITDAGESKSYLRTPRLDLDSLFGEIDATDRTPARSVEFRGGLGLGLTAGAPCNRQDLPRAASGEAQIADGRNDANLAVAQFTVMMTRFYWKMLACRGNPEDAQRATKHHFQHVVLDDYLRKIIDPDVYEDVVHNGGPKIITRAPFYIPLEFALAAFRVGHSMVRELYTDFADNHFANVSDLRAHTFHGGSLDPNTGNERRLENSWTIRWRSLIDLPGSVSRNNAMAFDERMADGLHALPPWQFREIVNPDLTIRDPTKEPPETVIQLPVQTLLRGRLADLPDAQTLHAAIDSKLPSGVKRAPLQPPDQIAKVATDGLQRFLAGDGKGFTTSTPLWFYCLRESALPPACGQGFGPLTSRIVMETVLTAIAEDTDGILSTDGTPNGFVPDVSLVNTGGLFGLREFIHHAAMA